MVAFPSYTNETSHKLLFQGILPKTESNLTYVLPIFFLFIVTSWYAFNQSYFQYVKIEHTYFDARKYCEEQSGSLASISSEEEQTFLYKTFLLPVVAGKY